jgi:Uma2 family endonuclease
MVVELVSPGGETRDRVTKFRSYQAEGVEWYWLIDAEALDIEEYHLEAGRYVCTARHDRSEVVRPGALPGYEINPAAMMGESRGGGSEP